MLTKPIPLYKWYFALHFSFLVSWNLYLFNDIRGLFSLQFQTLNEMTRYVFEKFHSNFVPDGGCKMSISCPLNNHDMVMLAGLAVTWQFIDSDVRSTKLLDADLVLSDKWA